MIRPNNEKKQTPYLMIQYVISVFRFEQWDEISGLESERKMKQCQWGSNVGQMVACWSNNRKENTL